MSLAPGARLGAYEVLSAIGRGGMGEVWRARDTKLSREVALKILPEQFATDPDRLARFKREAQILASLNHSNIGGIHGLEESNGVQALVLELVEGPTLADRIAQGPIPLDEALPIAKQIAEALETAHEQGVIHRDLKPSNIKLRPDGRVKVLDFGLAKALDAVPATMDVSESPTLTSPAVTQAGLILGTAAYMSPEQAKGKPVDTRVDIWAFGCVFYEMLTGRRAFQGENVPEVLASVLMREPDWTRLPAATPIVTRHLVRRCLEKDPKQRLRDIGDARIELESARPGDDIVVTDRRQGPTRASWIAAAAGVAAVVTALTALVLRPQPINPRPVRLSVVAPPGTTFSMRDITEHPQFALSPDGSQLALVAAAPGERPRIWLRSFESGTAQPLTGTEGASGPFWSPDGREIAFQAQGKLKKIALNGGTPVDLVNLAFDVSNGAWSPEGVILFSRGNGGALYRVPSSGGPAIPATMLDSNRHETAHRWPQFLPDGRRFIVFVGSTTPAHAGVYLGSIDSTEIVPLLPSATNAIFAGPDSLLFEQNGTIVRQAINLQAGALRGQPESLGDPIIGFLGPGYLPLSVASNGTMAYWTQRLTTSELLWLDRTGRALGRVGSTMRRYDNPVLSRDGTKVLVTFRENSNSNEIWRFDLASGGASRLTFTRGVARFPIWAPDSQTIAFSSLGDEGSQIVQKSASGAGEESRLEGLGRHWAIFPDDWSFDGRWLLYDVSSETAMDVWALSLQEGKAQPVLQSPANEVQPRLAPNGRWLAYGSDETGTWEVYVQGFGGTVGKWQVSAAGGSQPMWRADGRELFYIGPDGRMFVVAIGSGQTFEFQSPRPLFQTALPPILAPFRTGYAVSADGQRFLINSLRPDPEPSAITVVLNWDAALRSGN